VHDRERRRRSARQDPHDLVGVREIRDGRVGIDRAELRHRDLTGADEEASDAGGSRAGQVSRGVADNPYLVREVALTAQALDSFERDWDQLVAVGVIGAIGAHFGIEILREVECGQLDGCIAQKISRHDGLPGVRKCCRLREDLDDTTNHLPAASQILLGSCHQSFRLGDRSGQQLVDRVLSELCGQEDLGQDLRVCLPMHHHGRTTEWFAGNGGRRTIDRFGADTPAADQGPIDVPEQKTLHASILACWSSPQHTGCDAPGQKTTATTATSPRTNDTSAHLARGCIAPTAAAPRRTTQSRAGTRAAKWQSTFSRPAAWGRLVVVAADADRERLARTFDGASDLYQRARPEYPTALFERLLQVTHLQRGALLLEVGCATGKATLPLAQRGFRITRLEPGPSLAAVARRNLAAFDVEVVETPFEDWRPGGEVFEMVFAATAWNWVDLELRYHKAAQALRPRGYLAFWSAGHVIPTTGDPFFVEIQDVYEEIGEGLPPDTPLPRPGELDDQRDAIEASGLFEVLDISQFDWETVYDADGYIDLLNTFSGHIAMQHWQRDRLYGEIRRRLAQRPDGQLRRHWGGVLHIAQRKD
jgi:SAM-dependent methyltransferase